MGSSPSRPNTSSYSSYPGARRSQQGTPPGVTSSMPTTNQTQTNTTSDNNAHRRITNNNNTDQRRSNAIPSATINTSTTQSTGTRTSVSSSRIHSGPGAYLVEPGGSSSSASVFRVGVPEGISAGEEFQVFAGNRVVRVRCPPNARPGHFLQITVP